jgi:hypothetical protein
MAVTLLINAANNTGSAFKDLAAGFDVFVREASQKSGMLEKDIRANAELMEKLVGEYQRAVMLAKEQGVDLNKKMAEFAKSGKSLEDFAKKAGDAEINLRGIVQRANALNLTPRGFEMTAYRMAGLVESLGMAAPALIAVAAGAYAASTAIGRMYDVFLAGKPKKETETLTKLSEAFKELVAGAGYLAIELAGPSRDAVNDYFDSWNEGLKDLKEAPMNIFRMYAQAESALGEFIGSETLKKAGENFEKAIADADKARREDLQKLREAAAQKAVLAEDEQIAGKRNITVLKEQLDATQNLARIESFRADIRKLFLEEAAKTENEAVLAQKTAVWKANEAAIEEEINQRRKDRLAIEKEVRQIEAGQAADAAAAARGPRSELQITTEMDFQLRLAKDANQTEKDRQKALEKRKELEKELSEVVKERHRAEKEAERVAREAEREREHAEKERLRLLEQERREQERLAEIERRRAEQELQRFQQEVNRRLGEQGVGGVMDQLDPRGVRENFARNRVAAESRDFLEQQKKERAAFNERQDELTADGDPYSIRARMQAEAQFRRNQDRARAQFMHRSRAGAFRDFNRGEVDPNELRQAQDQTLGQMVQNGMQQGRISQKTALAMQEQVRALRQQQAQLDEVERAVDEIRAIQGTANRQTKRRAAQGKF